MKFHLTIRKQRGLTYNYAWSLYDATRGITDGSRLVTIGTALTVKGCVRKARKAARTPQITRIEIR